MNRFNGNRNPPDSKDTASTSESGERRRMGRVVHDDRGAASVEWRDAPDDYERPVLRIEGSRANDDLSLKNDDTFNPYDRSPDGTLAGNPGAKGGKRDLKKLSEWLKLMREMEARKEKGEE